MSSIVSFVGDRVSKKLVVLVGLSLALPLIALAQQGQDAVYNSTGQVTNSPAFIDASMFASSVQSPNLCSVLNWVLNPQNHILTSAGAVIDARGLPGTTPPTSLMCSMSPWGSGSSTVSVPSTILLPATGAISPNAPTPIIIPNSSPWILPRGLAHLYVLCKGGNHKAGGPLKPLFGVSGDVDVGCPILFAFFAKGWEAAPECLGSATALQRGVVNQ